MSAPGRPYLTPRQRAVLDFIGLHVAYQGYPPTYREIGDACGLTSVSSVEHVLSRLQTLGYIRREPGRVRAIAILDVVA